MRIRVRVKVAASSKKKGKMPRSRSLKFNIWLDYGLSQLSPWDRLLYLGLGNCADREGRLVDFPEEIGGFIFPYEVDRPINDGLQRLHDAGHIRRYKAGGQSLIQIVQWKKWQRPQSQEPPSVLLAYMVSDVAEINSGNIGQHRAISGNIGQHRATSLGTGPGPGPGPVPEKGLHSGPGGGSKGADPASEEAATHTDDFGTFMNRYPLMHSEEDFESAKQAWASLVGRGVIDDSSLPEVMAGIETYDEATMGAWPTPDTFLLRGYWKLGIQQARAAA